jgi:hypothetical protein
MKIKEDEMNGTYSTHGRDKYLQNFYWKNLEGRDHSKDLGVDGKIRMALGEIGVEVDWIHLVQDRDHRWAVVKMVMNLRVPKKGGNFLNS